jgi:hypothetical protein
MAEQKAAHNVFHHLSYEALAGDLDKITDEIDRASAESHIQNFGQTPSQLLQSSPHPEQCLQQECWEPDSNCALFEATPVSHRSKTGMFGDGGVDNSWAFNYLN